MWTALCALAVLGAASARNIDSASGTHSEKCQPYDAFTGTVMCCLLDPETGEEHGYSDGQITPPLPFNKFGCYCQEGQRVCNNTKAEEEYAEGLAKAHILTKEEMKKQEEKEAGKEEYHPNEMTDFEKDEVRILSELIKQEDTYDESKEIKPIVPTKPHKRTIQDVERELKDMKIGELEFQIGRKKPEGYKDPFLEEAFQKEKKERENSILNTWGVRKHKNGEERV